MISLFARLLSLFGHKKRKKADRAKFIALHDKMRADAGLPPFQWRR
jgi:cbb3-type cytochrome oxidase subunit 3